MNVPIPIPLPTWKATEHRIDAVRAAARTFLATSEGETLLSHAVFSRFPDDSTTTRDSVRHHARKATLASLEALYEACTLLDDLHMSQNEREEIEPSRPSNV